MATLCSSTSRAGAAVGSAVDGCPDLRVEITGIEITPKTPAQTYALKLSWAARAPHCFTISGFAIRGVVTFAGGQTRSFAGTASGDQTHLIIQVSGLAGPLPAPGGSDFSRLPKRLAVNVVATATAPVAGDSSAVQGGTGSQPCPLVATVQLTEAAFDGNVLTADVGSDRHPRVKVLWQLPNLPDCHSINQFTIQVTMRAGDRTFRQTATAPGTHRSASVIFDAAVAADFRPERVNAVITARGQAKITGSARTEVQVNSAS
jgi:hypothetical protein